MPIPFIDRIHAGRQLAHHLGRFGGRPDLIVLGLPRGGVPVAAEVARTLHAPLDAFVVRKLGVPGREELAMGAVASGGIRVLQPDTIAALRIPEATVSAVTEEEEAELARREQRYRGARPFPDLHGSTVLLVDDGVATGATMLAAVTAIRQRDPAVLVAAAPVMSVEAYRKLQRVADAVVAILVPEEFGAVGIWYRDFGQTSDEEVLACLRQGGALPAGGRRGADHVRA